MKFLIHCDTDGCPNAQQVQFDAGGKPILPPGWAGNDEHAFCFQCVGQLAADLEAACLEAGGVKTPDGNIDMSKAKLPEVGK